MRARHLLVAFLLSAPVLAAPDDAGDAARVLKEATDLFRQARFSESVALLRQSAILTRGMRDERVRAQQILAFNAVALGDVAGAEEAFAGILALAPDFDLDRSAHGPSPTIVALFDSVAEKVRVPRVDLEGTVTIAGKRPGIGVRVRVQGKESVTDKGGRFTLPGVRCGRLRLWISGDYVSDTQVYVTAAAGTGPCVVALDAPTLVTVHGVVRDGVGGGGLPGVSVRLGDQRATTDDRGRFSFRRVPTGQREVLVEGAQVETVWYAECRRSVEVQAGKGCAPVDVVLVPEGPGLIVRSTPPGATILVDDEERGLRTPGLVADLAPGWHHVRVEMPGKSDYGAAEQMVKVPARGVVVVPLTLEMTAPMARRGGIQPIVWAGIAAAGGGLALAVGGGGGKSGSSGTAQSTASVRGYVFRMDYPNRARGLLSTILHGRQDAQLQGQLFLRRDRNAPPGCQPAAGAIVTLSDGITTMTRQADTEGGFTFTTNLGTYTLGATLEGYAPVSTSVDLTVPQETMPVETPIPDVVAPTVVTAAAVDSTHVDVTFSETVDPASAIVVGAYALAPSLAVDAAEVRPDWKTVRLTTGEQSGGTSYAVTVSGVKDAAGNAVDARAATAHFTGTGVPPRVDRAEAQDSMHIQVTFSESLDEVTAGIPAFYTFTPPLMVTSATPDAEGRKVVLTTAEQTAGVAYRLTVAGVRDRAGNPIGSTGNYTTLQGIGIAPQVAGSEAVDSTHVRLEFSEGLQQASAETTGNYSFSPPLAVSGAELLADGITVILTTSEQLGGASYAASVSRVKDLAGNIIGGAGNTATFTGIGVAPRVVSALVVDSTHVLVTFDERVDTSTANTAGNYRVSPALSISTAALQADGKSALLATGEQTEGTGYTVTVSGVNDAVGNRIGDTENAATFVGRGTPPQVTAAVALDSTHVDVTFSENVQAQGAQAKTNYTITPDLVVESADLRADGRTVRLTTRAQAGGVSYAVAVAAVTDLAGNPVPAGANTATFTGVAEAMRVVSATVGDSTHVDVLFSAAVDSTTASATGNYAISPPLSVLGAERQADGTTVRLTTGEQVRQVRYTLTVARVRDEAGNTLAAPWNSASFAGVGTAPWVVSAEAKDSTHVDVLFSEAVDASTANLPTAYTFDPALSVSIASLQPDGKTVRLATSEQTGGAGYTVTASGVKDIAGNALENTSASAAFTGIGLPPRVVSATAVDSTHVDVVLSEALDATSVGTVTNYLLAPGLAVSAADLRAGGTTVRLTTAEQCDGCAYTVSVSGVKDVVGNPIGTTSNTAQLTGIGVPPLVTSATTVDSTHVEIAFSETVAAVGAGSPASYLFAPALSVTAADLQANGKVILTTAIQNDGVRYTITVSGVQDLAGNLVSPAANTASITGAQAPPHVLSATVVDETHLDVVFDEAVEPASATVGGNYGFAPALSVGLAQVQGDGRTVRLTTQEQRMATAYVLTVSGVRDVAGNTITGVGSSASFTGVGSIPRVVSAAAVDERTVEVVFSEAVAQASAETIGNYALAAGPGGAGVTISAAARQSDSAKVRLSTSSHTHAISYTVTVANVADAGGNVIGSTSNSAAYTAVGAPPQPLSATVVDETHVDVLFDEAVQSGPAETAGNYTFDHGLAASAAELQGDARTVRLTVGEQTTGMRYTVTVGALSDLAGNTISGSNNTASFTGAGTAPTVVLATPVNETTVDVLFSEAVQSEPAETTGNYMITPSLAVSGAALQGDGRTVRLTTAEPLNGVSLTVAVSGVKDLAANPVGVTGNTAVYTGIGAPPRVASASAPDRLHVDVLFSEDLDQTSAQVAGNYSVAGLTVMGAMLRADRRTVRLALASPGQVVGTVYTAAVAEASVKDLAGNAMASSNRSASFSGVGSRFYVNDNSTTNDEWCIAAGDDANDGLSPAAPKATVQSVLADYDLEPGDIVSIDTGTYNVAAAVHVAAADAGSELAPLTFEASPYGTVFRWTGIVDPSARVWSVDGENAVLTTAPGTQHPAVPEVYAKAALGSAGLYASGDNLQVRRWQFVDNTDYGVFLAGANGAAVENCLLSGNGDPGTGAGVRLDNSASVTLRNCTIRGDGKHGVLVNSSSDSSITNCILCADGAAGYGLYYIASTIGTTDYNAFHLTGGARAGNNGADRASLLDWQTATGKDTHSFSADPLFVDAAGDDFHLQSATGSYHGGEWTADMANSPCIDAGMGNAGLEPAPNATPLYGANLGMRNLGAYGGTEQASKSSTSRALHILAPLAGGNHLSSPLTVRWLWAGTAWQSGDTVKLEYSADSGATWNDVSGGGGVAVEVGQYSWDTSALAAGLRYRVRATCNQDAAGAAQSAGNFRVGTGAFFYVNDGATTNDEWCTAAGSDANDGLTPATPKATVQSVLHTYGLEPGDTVRIDTGTYNLTSDITVPVEDDHVTFEASPWGVIIDRGDTTSGQCWAVRAGYVTLTTASSTKYPALAERWMKLTGAWIGVSLENARCTIRRCYVTGNPGRGIAISNAYYSLVENCIVTGATDPASGTGIGAFYSAGHLQQSLTVRNCTVIGNAQYGVCWTDGYGTVRNSVVCADGPGSMAIRADRLADCDYNDLYVANGATVSQSCATLADWQSATSQDVHSISTDPLFADAAGGDFHLKSTFGRCSGTSWTTDASDSPCINAGDPATGVGQEPSNNGSRVNMGAYGGTEQASKGAGTFYVNDGSTTNDNWCIAAGDDANPGLTPEKPKATVQSVLSTYTLQGGDSVRIDTGIYNLASDITVPGGAAVTFAASPYGVTIDRGNTAGGTYAWQLGSNVTLTTVSSAKLPGVAQRYMRITGANGGVNVSGSGCLVRRCEIADNPGVGVDVQAWSPNVIVENCVIYGSSVGARWVHGSNNATLRNSTLYGNATGMVVDWLAAACLQNTIIWANGVGNTCIRVSGSTVSYSTCDYNDLYASNGASIAVVQGTTCPTLADWRTTGQPYGANDTHSLSTNPLFVDVAGGDFHLKSARGSYHDGAWSADAASSPCIDASDPATAVANELQPHGGLRNLGAYGGTEQASKSSGMVYYVNDNSTTNDAWCSAGGSAANDGLTPGTPKATVQAILDAYDLGPGDTVRIDTGTYTGAGVGDIDVSAGDDGSLSAPVVIEGSPYGVTLDRADTSNNCYVASVYADYVTLRTATSNRNPSAAQRYMRLRGGYGGVNPGREGMRISRCEIVDNTVYGINVWGSNVVIDHCVVRNSRTGVINTGSSGNIDMSNCTLYGTLYGADLGHGMSYNIWNNIIWADGTGGSALPHGLGSWYADYNCVYGTNGATAVSGGTHGLVTDPLLADAANGDCHLKSTAGRYSGGSWVADAVDSPCIDAGTGAVGAEPAPNGGKINLGAYGGTEQASKSASRYYVNDPSTSNDEWCAAPGSDANDGRTPATPKATVQAILDAYDLEPGDRVRVDTGYYTLAANITVTAADEGVSGIPVVFEASPYGVTFDRNNAVAGCYCWQVSGSYVTLTTATSTKHPAVAQRYLSLTNGYCGAYLTGTGTVLSRCDANANVLAGVWPACDNGTALLENCVLRDSADPAQGAGARCVLTGGSVTLSRCTIVGNAKYGVHIGGSGATIRNCIIWADGPGRYAVGSWGNMFNSDYNDLYATGEANLGYWGEDVADLANWRSATGQDAHSISVDPAFVSASDLHLKSARGSYHNSGAWTVDAATSPCVDAADPAASYANEPFPNGERANLGAYGNTEYASKSMAVYYVNDGSTTSDNWCAAAGDDANDGRTPATPKATVQAVIDAYDLEPGDTVRVDTGTYDLSANIVVGSTDGGSAAGQVTFEASPYGVTFNRGDTTAGAFCWVLDGCYLTLTTASSSKYPSVPQRFLQATGGYIGIRLGAGCVARRCDAANNALHGISVTGTGTLVENCIARGNATGSGVWCSLSPGSVTIRNCTMHGNVHGIYWQMCDATLANNVVCADGAGRYALYAGASGTIAASDYNDLYLLNGASAGCSAGTDRATLADWRSATGKDANSLSVDPRFANAAAGDFHLKSTVGRYSSSGVWTADALHSPCIDAGDSASAFDQEPEANGDRINMGAYGNTEFASKSNLGRSRRARPARLRAVCGGQEAWAYLSADGLEVPDTGDAAARGPASAGGAVGQAPVARLRFVPAPPVPPASASGHRSSVTGRSWSFAIEGAAEGGEVTLTWPDLSALGAKNRVTLEDLDADARRNMRTTASYVFRGEARHFRVTAVPRTGPLLAITELALEGAGRSGARIVRVTLSADASLDLDVVSPTGVRMADITRARAVAAGTNRIVWRATLGPGIYLLRARVTTDDGTAVQAVRPIVVAR